MPSIDDRRRRRETLVVSLTAIGLLAGCDGGRPSSAEWTERWDDARALVPTEEQLVDGGRSF